VQRSGGMHPTIVHVSDVARVHVLALGSNVSQKRILAQGGYLFWRQAAEYLHQTRPELKDRLPSLEAEGGDEPRTEFIHFEGGNAEKLFGMKWKTWQETVDDNIDDLLAREKALAPASA